MDRLLLVVLEQALVPLWELLLELEWVETLIMDIHHPIHGSTTMFRSHQYRMQKVLRQDTHRIRVRSNSGHLDTHCSLVDHVECTCSPSYTHMDLLVVPSGLLLGLELGFELGFELGLPLVLPLVLPLALPLVLVLVPQCFRVGMLLGDMSLLSMRCNTTCCHLHQYKSGMALLFRIVHIQQHNSMKGHHIVDNPDDLLLGTYCVSSINMDQIRVLVPVLVQMLVQVLVQV